MKAIFFFCMVMMIVFAVRTQACEFHGGFDEPASFRYGQKQYYLRSDYSTPQESVPESAIQITAPSMLNAKRRLKTDIIIKYTDTSVDDALVIQVDFKADPYITIESTEINTNGKIGEYLFTVIPRRIGTHRLVFTAKYANQPNSPERHTVIYLKVSD